MTKVFALCIGALASTTAVVALEPRTLTHVSSLDVVVVVVAVAAAAVVEKQLGCVFVNLAATTNSLTHSQCFFFPLDH